MNPNNLHKARRKGHNQVEMSTTFAVVSVQGERVDVSIVSEGRLEDAIRLIEGMTEATEGLASKVNEATREALNKDDADCLCGEHHSKER